MYKYQAIRISTNNRPTYGDRYRCIESETELRYNDIVSVGNDRYLVLFEQEEA